MLEQATQAGIRSSDLIPSSARGRIVGDPLDGLNADSGAGSALLQGWRVLLMLALTQSKERGELQRNFRQLLMRFSLVTIVMCIAGSAAFAGDSNLARNMGVKKWIFGEVRLQPLNPCRISKRGWRTRALLLYDAHESQRRRVNLSGLDVKSGKRRPPAFDMQAAVRSLRSL